MGEELPKRHALSHLDFSKQKSPESACADPGPRPKEFFCSRLAGSQCRVFNPYLVATGANVVTIPEVTSANGAPASVPRFATHFFVLLQRRLAPPFNDGLDSLHGWLKGNRSFDNPTGQVVQPATQLAELFVCDA